MMSISSVAFWMKPVNICEFSRGRGGFMLSGRVTLADGRVRYIASDGSWLARRMAAYTAPDCFDASLPDEGPVPAATVENIWHCDTAPIPVCTEARIDPLGDATLTLAPGEVREFTVEFDRIYGGYAAMEAAGDVRATLDCIETDVSTARFDLRMAGDSVFRSFRLVSAGAYRIRAENLGHAPARLSPFFVASCYPADTCAVTVTDDPDLDRVLDVCRHSLRYCRQSMHLDSPRHAEPLTCTGDYWIESLMTAMSFGDMALAAFDLRRTAEMLRVHDGRMFHTSYSLIWVIMLRDVYMLTGEAALLADCADALQILLDRFAGYIGENGLPEYAPDYMFVDWIYIDGISMHHPPKALGQTCLAAFYHGSLLAAGDIYRAMGQAADAAACADRARRLRDAVNTQLFDEARGLYFDGLNTPTPAHLVGRWMPQNTSKRYYMPHSNILCACFGICGGERARSVLEKVVTDPDWGAVQPYFMHYLLEAVYAAGLRDAYTLRLLDAWKAPTRDCPKGLVEGFIRPEPGYSFDHSHAWGGTPLYALPRALLGLDILESGYRRIRLAPSLLGLGRAHVEVPTPFGMLTADLAAGEAPVIAVPPGIEAEIYPEQEADT